MKTLTFTVYIIIVKNVKKTFHTTTASEVDVVVMKKDSRLHIKVGKK